MSAYACGASCTAMDVLSGDHLASARSSVATANADATVQSRASTTRIESAQRSRRTNARNLPSGEKSNPRPSANLGARTYTHVASMSDQTVRRSLNSVTHSTRVPHGDHFANAIPAGPSSTAHRHASSDARKHCTLPFRYMAQSTWSESRDHSILSIFESQSCMKITASVSASRSTNRWSTAVATFAPSGENAGGGRCVCTSRRSLRGEDVDDGGAIGAMASVRDDTCARAFSSFLPGRSSRRRDRAGASARRTRRTLATSSADARIGRDERRGFARRAEGRARTERHGPSPGG